MSGHLAGYLTLGDHPYLLITQKTRDDTKLVYILYILVCVVAIDWCSMYLMYFEVIMRVIILTDI